jgi:4a-hydroxytetrahydrobiopterin dehydratase
MSTPLTSKEISQALENLPGWEFADDAISKNYQFGSFREAMSFMMRVSFEAEELDHHPEWMNVYNCISVRLCTHDADGKVTAKDTELAQRFEKINWVE